MYNFERRLNLVKKSFDDVCAVAENNQGLISEQIEIFVMLARTITFIIQKELSGNDNFSAWYGNKRVEMSYRFRDFVDMRNNIEKEGVSPVRAGTISINFQCEGGGVEKVGVFRDSNGNTKDVMGKMTNIHYFDKGREKEIVSTCREYLSYLSELVEEAVKTFPEKS